MLHRGGAAAWRAVHPSGCPSRPWGYGARPLQTGAPAAAGRGLQLLASVTAGAAAYAYYHKVFGYGHGCSCRHQRQ